MREEEFNITEEKAPSEFQKLIEGLISPVDFVSRTDFNTINWNGLPDDKPRNQDRTLAWLASYRALENQPALLEKLLASSPIILEEIDWNARPLDEKNIQRGRTVTLMACSLARRGQPVLLEKLLAGSPVILEKIDWNACPLNEKYTHRGETVAWMACSLARRGQPALLEKLLAGSPAIMEKIDWNACPLDEKNKHRGFTVALQACTLASKGLPALLEKLFSRSSTILENIDWCSKHFKLIGNTPPVSLLSTVFTQNNARLFLLLLEWSGPALQNLKTALLSSGLTTTDTTRQPLFCWIDFSLLVNSPKKPTIPDADEIAKLLQNIKKILPDLYGRACLHTCRQWPCLRQRFYPDIPPASPDYGTAQWELANMYLNEQDEKETPAKRELGLKEALSAASRCWYHEIRMSPDQTKGDGRLLVRIIVKAILGWPPGELTCDLPGYVESLLKEDAQYYTTHRHDLRPHELDLKINNLWLSLKIFLIEERHAATMKSITEYLKNQPGYLPAESLRREPSVNNDQKNIVIDGIPNQSDQNGTGQNKKRKVLHQTNLSDLFPSPRLDVFPGNSRSSTALPSSHSEQPTELNRYKGITNE